MTSSRQPRELNLGSFMAWAASRTDDEFRAIAHRGALSRKEIAKKYGVGRSALDQNPRMLEVIEQRAGAKSVLITSQLPIDRWHDYLTTGGKSGAGGNATYASGHPILNWPAATARIVST